MNLLLACLVSILLLLFLARIFVFWVSLEQELELYKMQCHPRQKVLNSILQEKPWLPKQRH
jgi:hypothetical protein